MTLEVLISCMHQKDASIVRRTNIQSDVLVINQCDEDRLEEYEFVNKQGDKCKARIIYTTERGLSKSRNMAIRNACGDVCLFCDNDEILVDDYPQKILSAYRQMPNIQIFAFPIQECGFITKKHSTKIKKIGYLSSLKISTWQLTFNRKAIVESGINFDETMGSGTGNGGGEEQKFMFTCLRRGMKIVYIPSMLGEMIENESMWFHGFTDTFFYNQGYSSRKIMGHFLAVLYAFEFAVMKYPKYKKDNTFISALIHMLKGIFLKKA